MNAEGAERPTGAWWSRHFVAVSGGLGLGLLAYRYGVLPFVVTTPSAKLFLWIGVGLLIGARKGYKAGLGDVTAGIVSADRMATGLIAAAFGFGAGFIAAPPVGYLRLAPRTFPGFRVSLPASQEAKADHSDDYAAGQLTLLRPGGSSGAIQVTWAPGGLPDQSALLVFARRLAAAFGDRPADVTVKAAPPERQDSPTTTWVIRTGARDVWLSVTVCGSRSIAVQTGAAGWGADRLHRRVVDSLQCQSDPSRRATMPSPL